VSKFHFKITPHTARDGDMVEVWFGNELIGGLYPGETNNSLRFISKYMYAAEFDPVEPPAVEIMLRRRQ